jgi:outer membrane protein
MYAKKYQICFLVTVCSAMQLAAEDKQATATTSTPVRTAPAPVKKEEKTVARGTPIVRRDFPDQNITNIISENADGTVIRFCDMFNTMATAADGKEKQLEMDALQRVETNNLERQRQESAKKLEEFNAKKDMLSKEARAKEEQELMALSRDLQNEVQKAQERVRHELNKATEELARAAEQAAIEVAKEEGVDFLIEKNTGRVIFSKDAYDLTSRVTDKMNGNRELRLAAQNKQQQPANAITVAAPHTVPPREASKVAAVEPKKAAEVKA